MRYLFVAIMIFQSISVSASDAQSPSLHNLIEMALKNNQEIKSHEYELKAQESLTTSASGLDSPMIGLSTLDRGAKTQYVTISQKIRFPNKYFMSSHAQKAFAKSSGALLKAVKLRIRSQIASLYYSIYSTQKEIQLTRANIESVKEFARVAEKKYAAGKTSQSDSMKAHFELTQLELEIIRLSQEEEALQDKLRAAMNNSDLKDLKLAEVELVPPDFYESQLRGSEDEIKSLLSSHSPMLQSAGFQLEEATTKWRLAQWEYVPDFQVQYQQRISGDPSDSSIFSVGISIPLWFWNQYSNASAAKSKKISKEYGFNDLSLKLTADVKDLLGKVKTGLKTLTIYKTSLLPQAQGAYNSSRSAYQANRTSFLDLLDSERALYRIKTGYYKSLNQYVMYLSQLESVIGFEVSNLERAQEVNNEK
ncbi:MAG: TolC family protein [Bdellovibrionales bacterium]|nr:TolC family protein [Bdellovibrionales bacterium]